MRFYHFVLVVISTFFISCSNVDPKVDVGNQGINDAIATSQLKILAIGNSFTINATDYLPFIISQLGEKNITLARLARGSCSLEMHWDNHLCDRVDYDLQYANSEGWEAVGRSTIDAALNITDWDIVVIQQVSGLSGIYSSYQPYLDELLRLFEDSNSHPRLAWQVTWAYAPHSTHPDFTRYDNDSQKMYENIVDAAKQLPGKIDVKIPSAQLIHKMRNAYPGRKDGLTTDGFHLADGLPCYAVSCLWHELLIEPTTGASCLRNPCHLKGLSKEDVSTVVRMIEECVTEY